VIDKEMMKDYDIALIYILNFSGFYCVLIGNGILAIYLMPKYAIIITLCFFISTTCGIFYKFDLSNIIGKAIVTILFGYTILLFIAFI
jgi:hypothetical protein